jgi:hypothetical protein
MHREGPIDLHQNDALSGDSNLPSGGRTMRRVHGITNFGFAGKVATLAVLVASSAFLAVENANVRAAEGEHDTTCRGVVTINATEDIVPSSIVLSGGG